MDMIESQRTIYIESTEEITSVIDRLKNIDAKDIVFVIPKGSMILQSIVNLKLLKKQARKHKKNIAIVTTDTIGRNLSTKAGIPVQKQPNMKIPHLREMDETEGIDDQTTIDEHHDEFSEKPLHVTAKYATRPLGRASHGLGTTDDGHRDEQDNGNQDEIVSGTDEPRPAVSIERYIGGRTKQTNSKERAHDNEDHKAKGTIRRYLERTRSDERSSSHEGGKIHAIDGDRRRHGTSANFDRATPPHEHFPKNHSKRGMKKVALIPHVRLKIALAMFAATAIAGCLFAWIVLPKAEITMTPKKETISEPFEVVATTKTSQIDIERSNIPAKQLEIVDEQTKEFVATGTIMKKTNATGTLTIMNSYDSSPQTLVAGTRFAISDGKTFRTDHEVTVPGFTREGGEDKPGSVSVTVTSAEPGVEYNIPPSRFSIPGFQGTPKESTIWGESSTPMAGGEEKEVRIVSETDLRNAEIELEQLISESLASKLDESSEGYVLADDGVHGSKTVRTSKRAQEEAEKFQMTMSVKKEALVYREDDLANLTKERLKTLIHEGYGETREKLSVNLEESEYMPERGEILLKGTLRGTFTTAIDMNSLREQLRGLRRDEAEKLLQEQASIASFTINLWPFWVHSIPNNSERIVLSLDTSK